jgi:16S rRNA U516 pseudouridylate synthase RsuA-like enzyme
VDREGLGPRRRPRRRRARFAGAAGAAHHGRREGAAQQDARVTVLVNKPVGYVSGQAEDGYEPASCW